MATKYIIGNWKMNQSLAEIKSFIEDFNSKGLTGGHFAIAAQAIHLHLLKELDGVKVGTQNCSEHTKGAFTGELSPLAIKELGYDFTLIGHSERRSIYFETNEAINLKVKTALAKELQVVLCVGETLAQREQGKTLDTVSEQLKSALKDVALSGANSIIVAYEPVWAIGTGKTASPEQAQEVHAFIRSALTELYSFGEEISILYGGSVKPSNVSQLLAQKDIDGGLVGGASLKASDFIQLCEAIL